MSTVSKKQTKEVSVTLVAQEVRAAIESAAWTAAVKADSSIVAHGSARIMPDGSGGYIVTFFENVAA